MHCAARYLDAVFECLGLGTEGSAEGRQEGRVDSVELAIKKAGDRAKGSVMASDAYFPFPDGIEVAADAGITAVIQPGGSVRDQEVIKAANAAHIAMIFTNRRHFKH